MRSRLTPEFTVTPVRTCIGCRSRRPAQELIRCTLREDVAVLGGASDGRGAWLCRNVGSCLEQALRKRGFDRAWRRPVAGHTAAGLRESFGADALHVKELTAAHAPVPTGTVRRGVMRKG